MSDSIAVKELEAWYFGGWEAVHQAHPRIAPNVPKRAHHGNPDAIRGGTWEAFARMMKKHGYSRTRLGKVEAAREIALYIDPARNRSRSFTVFHDALIDATA